MVSGDWENEVTYQEEHFYSESGKVLALLPRAVGVPSLEALNATHGVLGSLSWWEEQGRGLELHDP